MDDKTNCDIREKLERLTDSVCAFERVRLVREIEALLPPVKEDTQTLPLPFAGSAQVAVDEWNEADSRARTTAFSLR